VAEWFVMVDGVRMTWEQIVFKLSTGTWTLAEAVRLTALTPRALSLRLALTEAAGGTVGRAAASALVRLGLTKVAAGVAGAGAGAAGAGAAGAGGLGVLGWLGVIGVIAAIAAGGYWVYTRNQAPSATSVPISGGVVEGGGAERGGVELGGAGDGDATPCPDASEHQTACPWTPAGYAVGTCGPGKCWDGGPQGTLACKQPETPTNAGRSYTNDVVCGDGFAARFDRCTGVVLSCDPS